MEVYAIVLFLPRKDTDNLIDLIPSSWIFMDERVTVCRYSGSEDYDKLPHWVALLQKSEEK